ncbi:Heat shock protein 89.1 isoform 2 [Hibiscus syriacus]|uniref:Heat shock protein 89.1 isoform 2 n=1 Tax=Hibiscus syriacus TaxID=106335 RepID=A0A6A3CD18_HIBSY|nr:Heat shock protein 89.1 isoform 2 [Hibiscus syriacus]
MKVPEEMSNKIVTYYDTSWRNEGLLTWKYASMNSVDFLIEKKLNAAVVDYSIGIYVDFTDLQRNVILDVATISGLQPLHLIHETIATTLACGIYKSNLPENDPLNVALVNIGRASMKVYIVAFKKQFATKFKKEYKIDVFQNDRACTRLRAACEKLKKEFEHINAPITSSTSILISEEESDNNSSRYESTATTSDSGNSPPPPAEKYEYQAKVIRIMDLIFNSLYNNKEVFLRELISNASDSLDKLRYLSVTDSQLLKEVVDLDIHIQTDKDNGIITITDSGIGMTKQKLVDYLGTIAHIGTTKILKTIKECKDVVVSTKSLKSDKQYVWEGEANASSYSIWEETNPENLIPRGTRLTLYLKRYDNGFVHPEWIQKLVKNYSQFVSFPIYTWQEKGITKEPREVTTEEYNEFYMKTFNEYSDLLGSSHFTTEGEVEFLSVLYVPTISPIGKNVYFKQGPSLELIKGDPNNLYVTIWSGFSNDITLYFLSLTLMATFNVDEGDSDDFMSYEKRTIPILKVFGNLSFLDEGLINLKKHNKAITQLLLQWTNLRPENITGENYIMPKAQFLVFDPGEKDPFMEGVDGVAPDKPLDSLVLGRIKQFSATKKLKKMALRADVDNSGTIDYQEFIAATFNLNMIEKEDNLLATFSYFDSDGSGYITQDELQKACQELRIDDIQIGELMCEVDQDNDGHIDYNEFVALMHKGDPELGQGLGGKGLTIGLMETLHVS